MAQIPYRGNTQGMSMPLLSRLAGRAVIDPGADHTYYPQVTTDGQVPIDRGVPTVVYGHNIMPSTYGWQSVGYNNVYFAPSVEEAAIFYDLHFIQCTRGGQDPAPTGTKTYIALGNVVADNQAYLYVMDTSLGNWRRITGGLDHPTTGDPFVFPLNAQMTSTTLNGVTYFYIEGIGCFLYDDTIDAILFRELNGLDPADILGITGSNGYMLAWTANSVAWSSSVEIEDFEPSDISGAGGGSLQEAEGRIIAAVATVHGVIFMTDQNAVSAVYSGNEDFPWTFKAIPGSGGIANPQQISGEQAANYFYAYTTYGLQQISHIKCNTVLPHIADFIGGGIFEDFDYATDTFTQVDIGYAMPKQLVVISDRYVVISYGKSYSEPFSHAVVVDLSQSRMGKLKVLHNRCFERRDLTFSAIESPRDIIGFLQPSGQCLAVDFSFSKVAFDSVLIFGKFQLQRTNLMTIEEVQLENVEEDTSFSCSIFSSFNGKELGTKHTGYLLEQATDYKHFLFSDAIGINHSMMLKGTFNIQSYVLWGTQHGRI